MKCRPLKLLWFKTMYFPIGWPKYLKEIQNDSPPLQYVISSSDRMLFAILSEDTLSIWYCKPTVQIVNYTQSQKDLDEVGGFVLAEWKPDSSMIAVMTNKKHVIFFKVELDVSVPNHHCLYVQQEGRVQTTKRDINGIPDSDSIPAVKLTPLCHITLSESIACCLCVREELVIATQDGYLNRVRWNGTRNDKASLYIRNFPVSIDFQHTKAAKLTEEDGYVVHMEYSPIIGGYICVLSSGRSLFVIPPSSRVENGTAQGVWIQDLKDATCLAVNHRYRLMAFGCKSGIGIVYVINELEGTFEESHKMVISSKDYPDAGQIAGSVQCMKWTPDGTAIALCWKNGGFSLWSVFGSLLVCTLGGDYMLPNDDLNLFPPPVKSLEWGLEGYQLWIVSQSLDENNSSYNGFYHVKHEMSCVMQLQFVKSALTVNPCMANHEHVFLQGEDKLYMSTGDTSQRNSSHSEMSIGNKQWQIIPISHSYLASNWPIRYAAVDKAGQCLAVAGKTGLAHYTLYTRKWKLFGNETQEKDLVVSGGMAWWKDFICVACYNIVGQRDEIRCYPRNCKLDNTFAVINKVPSQILLLNTFRDILIVFCIDSHVMLFNLERKNTQPNPTIEMTKIQEVSLSSFVPHPVCVTGLALTSLKTELGARTQHTTKEAESLLLNVAGKLLMFQRDRSGPHVKTNDQNQNIKSKQLPFCSPSPVATNVENLWTTSRANLGKMQLMESLWLGCGAHGMKVWLPLYPRDEAKAHNFMSKRIMLPFRVDIYPLAVLFEDAVILGAASDALTLNYKSPADSSSTSMQHLPFCTLERTSQIYLHHILRQLLRRNLGVNALDIARCCTELSYFPHVLELLLHEVLEAEATSKDPIPDPLLPRVVAFIQEFPEFLQTVVHCARKTEVALWDYLFRTVGYPKDLFEECLLHDELETAASYLIILQNLEKPIISRQHATLLLDASLEKGKWDLARDLVRFLKAIDPSDVESPQPLGPYSRHHTTPSGYPSPPISPQDAEGFSFSNVSNVSNISRVRSSSVTTSEGQPIPKAKEKLKHTVSDNLMHIRRPSPKPKDDGPADLYIDVILCRHARKLIDENRLKDLGCFAGNTEDFHLVAWLKRERLRAGKVDDFVTALRDLHHQFQWPLPILSYTALQQLKNKTFSTSSLASLSILDDDVNESPADQAKVNEFHLNKDYNDYMTGMLKSPSQDRISRSYSDEVILKPQISKVATEDSSIATVEISDNNSLLGEFEYLGDSSSCADSLSTELEILSQEIANKGPLQSELELRYMLQIMLEAGCLEWALIISIVLRDALAVVRTVNTASMTDTPLEIVARMREGLSFLELWSDTECLGYKPFFHAIRGQIQVLAKLVEQTPPTLQLSTTPVENSSVDERQLSPPVQMIRDIETDPPSDNNKEMDKRTNDKPSDCAIS